MVQFAFALKARGWWPKVTAPIGVAINRALAPAGSPARKLHQHWIHPPTPLRNLPFIFNR